MNILFVSDKNILSYDTVIKAKELLEYFEDEIRIAKDCIECYANDFTAVCSKLHLLIWAKPKGYNYWPAKVMSFDKQKQRVSVLFFGDQTHEYVSATNCFLYSNVCPTEKQVSTGRILLEELYKSALNVIIFPNLFMTARKSKMYKICG